MGVVRPERAEGRRSRIRLTSRTPQLKLSLATDKPDNNWDQHDAVNASIIIPFVEPDNADGPHLRACVRVRACACAFHPLAPVICFRSVPRAFLSPGVGWP